MAGRHIRRPANTVEWRCDADIDFEIGDLLFYDTSVEYVKPMADFTWDTSEEITRRNAIPYFVGVAAEKRTGREANDSTMIVESGCVFSMPMTSGTPVVGTLLGFEKASGDTLESQTLQIVTDPADAIGYCVKRYTAATTTVECVLFSPYDSEGGLMGRVKEVSFFADETVLAAAGNVVTDWTFKQNVSLIDARGILVVPPGTANAVLTFKNGATTLQSSSSDITLTLATAGAAGAVSSATLVGADSAKHLLAHDDTFDIVSDGGATGTGKAIVIVRYLITPGLET